MFPTPPSVQSDWFWSNYKKGTEWVKKHEAAYWKSQALSLAEENKKLLQIIHDSNVPQSTKPERSRSSSMRKKSRPGKKKRRRKLSSKAQSSDISVEVSKELVEFFKVSINHKEQLKKEKEIQEKKSSHFVPPQEAVDARLKEMEKLYGEDCSKIVGMETAMQLSYERYKDQKSPKYWPQKPLQF